jgi:uncharacterized membrane protein
MKMKMRAFTLIGALTFTCLFACNKDEVTPPSTDTYFPQVKAIITNYCLTCHSSAGDWAGRPVSFDSDEEIAIGYASIKAAVADPPTYINKRMPQDTTLSADQIDTIVKWFNKGGKITD